MADSIVVASQLDKINFPEFTAKLIDDTFNTLISANIRQMQSFSEMVNATSQTLTQYINTTKDEISLSEISEFLANIPIGTSNALLTFIPNAVGGNVAPTGSITTLPATTGPAVTAAVVNAPNLLALNTALGIGGTPGTISITSTIADILDAVAARISFNKYQLLEAMVKMGVLRIVVKSGVIESKLSFSTWNNEYSSHRDTEDKSKGFNAGAVGSYGSSNKAKIGIAKIFKIAGSVNYSNIKVSTSVNTQSSNSGTNINIMGRVEINFETDYLELKKSE